MTYVLIVVLLALLWAAITGTLTFPNLLLGAAVAAAALWLVRGSAARSGLPRRLAGIAALAGLAVRGLVLGTARLAVLTLTPDVKGKPAPAIVAMPLTVTGDREIALLAALLTFAPDTLGVDVSEDRGTLYLHALRAHDPERLLADARGCERRLIEVLR